MQILQKILQNFSHLRLLSTTAYSFCSCFLNQASLLLHFLRLLFEISTHPVSYSISLDLDFYNQQSHLHTDDHIQRPASKAMVVMVISKQLHFLSLACLCFPSLISCCALHECLLRNTHICTLTHTPHIMESHVTCLQ